MALSPPQLAAFELELVERARNPAETVALENLFEGQGSARLKKSAAGSQASERARRKGAPAEAEHEDLVARRVSFDEPAIGGLDVAVETVAEHAATEPLTEPGADAFVV